MTSPVVPHRFFYGKVAKKPTNIALSESPEDSDLRFPLSPLHIPCFNTVFWSFAAYDHTAAAKNFYTPLHWFAVEGGANDVSTSMNYIVQYIAKPDMNWRGRVDQCFAAVSRQLAK